MRKDEFYEDQPFLIAETAIDSVVVAGGFNARVKKLGESEAWLGWRCSLLSHGKYNGDMLSQFYADNHLFISCTNFRHSSQRTIPRCSNSASSLGHTDHVAVSYRWRGSIQNRESYWSAQVESDYKLPLLSSVLQLNDLRCRRQIKLVVEWLSDSIVRTSYE